MEGILIMKIDTDTVVSMTDANQNFSKVVRVVDKYGRAIIFKNNAPRYLVIDFQTADNAATTAKTENVLSVADRFMEMYDDAFKELAK